MGGVVAGGGKAGGHKILTPQSFGLSTEAGARLIIGRAPPVLSSSKPLGSKLTAAVVASHVGYDQSRRQSRSMVHKTSPPRTKSEAAPVTHESNNGWACGELIPSGCGVTSNARSNNGGAQSMGGGISITANGKHKADCSAIVGEDGSVGGRKEGGSARQHIDAGSRFPNDGNVGNPGAEYETTGRGSATIRIPSRGDGSVDVAYKEGAHHEQDSETAPGTMQQQPQQLHRHHQHQQQQQHQQQGKNRRDEDGGLGAEERGALLAGPEGCVEVRELEGGVLVVRRTWHEKKQSPERLNLHRRQLNSCPLVQVRDYWQGRVFVELFSNLFNRICMLFLLVLLVFGWFRNPFLRYVVCINMHP